MGSKKQRKNIFLTNHPLCCFCGGDTPATETDHIPSRVLFDNRQWPEGYEFPACVACNRETRHDEQIVALLSRAYPDANTPESRKETQERFRAVAHNYPEILVEMQATIRQKRTVAKKYDIVRPEGMAYKDMPFLNISGPLINKAVNNFGRKLFMALYYKHANEILPKNSGIALRYFSNLKIENGVLPQELADIVSNFPELKRCNITLHDQFFYRYVFSDTGGLSMFLAFFRQSFVILGFINKNSVEFQLPEGSTILTPYVHH